MERWANANELCTVSTCVWREGLLRSAQRVNSNESHAEPNWESLYTFYISKQGCTCHVKHDSLSLFKIFLY